MMFVDTGHGRRGILVHDAYNNCYGYAYNCRENPTDRSEVFSVQPCDGGQAYVARGDRLRRAVWTFAGMMVLPRNDMRWSFRLTSSWGPLRRVSV